MTMDKPAFDKHKFYESIKELLDKNPIEEWIDSKTFNLNPCPICNGKASHYASVCISDFDDLTQWRVKYAVHCENCGLSTPLQDSWQKASDIWNQT